MFEEYVEINNIDYNRKESQLERNISNKSLLIYIKTIVGKTITLDVTETETVENLKAKIKDKLGVPIWKQMLVYAYKILEENTILSDYNIKDESSIFLVIRFSTSKIYLKTIFDNTISLDYNQDLTIESIKKKVEETEKIKFNKQILIYNSEKLENNKTLSDYEIKKESNITLIVLDDYEKLNEELKKRIKKLEKEINDEQNKNKNLDKSMKDLQNKYIEEKNKNMELNNKIQSLELIITQEKQRYMKELENAQKIYIEEVKRSEEYKNKIGKLEKILGKKTYTKDDFLDIKNKLEKDSKKYMQNIDNKIKNMICINIMSNEEDIYWSCICDKNDIFTKIEINFYNNYPEYKNCKNDFIFNGIKVKEEKTLEDIGIKSNSIIYIKKNDK